MPISRNTRKKKNRSGNKLGSRTKKQNESAIDATPLGQPSTTGRPIVTEDVIYTIVPEFPDTDPRSKLGNGPYGSEGEYIVIYRLGVPGVQSASTEFNFDALESTGDSLIGAPAEVKQFDVSYQLSRDGDAIHNFTLSTNENHRLAAAKIQFHAKSFGHAAAQAHNLIMPFLSQLSFTHEVAITTTGRKMVEVATGICQLSQTCIGAVKGMSIDLRVSTPEIRRLMACYREGLSSCEPLYQVLSFYKVIEGVFSIRKIEREAIKEQGETLYQECERMPQDLSAILHPSDLLYQAEYFKPYVGRKFTDVRDRLRDTLRVPIAHLNFDEIQPFGADSYEDMMVVHRALPVLRYMARTLLSSVVSNGNNG